MTLYLTLNSSQLMALKDILMETIHCRAGVPTRHAESFVDASTDVMTTPEELLQHLMDGQHLIVVEP